MNNKKLIGILIFIILVVIITGIKIVGDAMKEEETGNVGNNTQVTQQENIKGLTTVYVATGGGKENFIADEDINKILREKYKLNVIYDGWSNGKLILWPMVREAVGKGNVSAYKEGESTINTPGLTPYDAIFSSDERYYNYYQLSPDKSKGEADRFRVQGGSLMLNTPIIFYSWDDVTEALINENIVTKKGDTYFITDMPKLMDYMLNKKKWKDIGLDQYYGSVEVKSVDPVKSSPGATYYGLLLSIYCEGVVTDETIIENLPSLREFYEKAGSFMFSPADLFDAYKFQRTPIIVDYEKSIINLANDEPENFAAIKDSIRLLYPEPTMWNSHCYQYLTDNGKLLFDAYQDPEIQAIAWERYGFRTGVVGGSYDTEQYGIGIPKTISQTVSGLKMEGYDKLIAYLKEKDPDKAYNVLHDITE